MKWILRWEREHKTNANPDETSLETKGAVHHGLQTSSLETKGLRGPKAYLLILSNMCHKVLIYNTKMLHEFAF